jgi:hypothetical protein
MARHLSLTTYDDTYPLRQDHINPLLKPESLRRLAWSVYYLHLTQRGDLGQSLDEPRISLPCDETCFLRGLAVRGNDSLPLDDMLNPPDLRHNECANTTHLGLSAHLLRTAGMRHRIQRYCSQVTSNTRLIPHEQVLADLDDLDRSASQIIRDLPPHLIHSEDNLYIHFQRRTSFLLLHMLRHSCFIILCRTRIAVSTPTDGPTSQLRERCIRHAVAVSWISGDGLQLGVNLDPYVAVLAYEALEGAIPIENATLLTGISPPALLYIANNLTNSRHYSTDPRDSLYTKELRFILDLLRKLSAIDLTAARLRVEACLRVRHYGLDLLHDADHTAILR